MGPRNLNRWLVVVCVMVAFLWSKNAVEANGRLLGSQADRMLVEMENVSESVSVLSARTERIDPLDNFKKYKGGYNITNKHYWSSTIFTGKYGYAIAALWIIGGLGYASVLLIMFICCGNKQRKKGEPTSSKRYCLWHVLLGLIFTILIIVASAVVLGGSSKFHSRAHSIKNIIVQTADEASATIYNATRAVKAMQDDTELYGNLDGSIRLNTTSHKLNNEADSIQRKAIKTMRRVNKGLKILKVVTIVTITLNLIAILASFGFSILASRPRKLRRVFYLLIILCWLLTILFWLYFGLYYFLDKFAGDTCIALDEYQNDPRNSSLGSILPCNDQLSSSSVLRDASAGIHDIIDQVNANISALRSISLPGLEYVCNPFSGPPEYNYQPKSCSSNTIQIGDIPQILGRYTCSGDGGETCQVGEFIPAKDYDRALVYTNSIQNILNTYPGMEKLVNCQLVKDAFSNILHNQCKPLKKYVHMTWASMATLSILMVLLILTWMLGACHDRKLLSADGSVKPHSTPTGTFKIDATEMAYVQQEDRLEHNTN